MDTLNIDSLTNYASNIAANKNTQAMTDKAKNAETDEELMDACKEFENYLWEQVIKSMKDTINVFGEDEDSSASKTVDYFMDSAISDVASSLTDSSMGPNSLAKQMYEQMKRNNTIDVEALLSQSREASNINNQNSNELSEDNNSDNSESVSGISPEK